MGRWYLLGDLHGSAESLKDIYNKNNERLQFDAHDNRLILLGDVGANFALKGQRDKQFKEELSSLPFSYICLRGNHEARVSTVMKMNPSDWNEITKYGGKIYIEKDFPKIEYLSDIPAVYDFDGIKTLSIPGAYSIDKWYRLCRGWPWYADEQLTDEEINNATELIVHEQEVDLVISHTCPLIFEPRDLFLKEIDQSMIDQTMERFLTKVESCLNYRRWAFGHFHADRLYLQNHGKQALMLYNEQLVDLKKFMEATKETHLQDIKA